MAGMGISRREARALGKVTGSAISAAANKLDESNRRATEKRIAEAGDSKLVRTQLDSAAMFRRQAEKFLAEAVEAEAAGKARKAARHRRAAERPLRQAEQWEAKAKEQAAKERAWAEEQQGDQPPPD